jgi:hypothetical protein
MVMASTPYTALPKIFTSMFLFVALKRKVINVRQTIGRRGEKTYGRTFAFFVKTKS